MKFKLLKIILWPVRTEFGPRIVEFDKPGVQVISGASKTGKSAIIPIIDYCLGADKCAIPVDTIRNSCSWFGLLIEADRGQILLGRREPGEQKTTGDMYLREGDDLSVPVEPPTKNVSVDAVKMRLNELSGLTMLDFDAAGIGSGFRGRPSFRDMMAFTFQPQNIVANPDVFFFKADTYEHREKLKTIFPYVLGAITPEVLAAQHELEQIKKELSRKEKELANIRQVSERWHAELVSWVSRAREYGLIKRPLPAGTSRQELYDLLTQALQVGRWEVINLEGITESFQELVDLQSEESQVDTELRVLRRRMNEMSKLRENATKYEDALRIQRDRLSIAKWLQGVEGEAHSCPFCDSPLTDHTAQLDQLCESLETLEAQTTRLLTMPASFDREMHRVREDMRRLVERLNGITMRKREVESRSEAAKQAGARSSEISRFLGRIEKGIEVHDSLGQDSELVGEVAELRERQLALSKIVSTAGTAGRVNGALKKISGHAQRHLPKLDMDRAKDPVSLSLTDLTIKITGQYREDYLWEVGSGANWLSYHIAVTLGLQEFFIEQRHSPVPRFLVYDQPSQVYFPRRLAKSRAEEHIEPKLADEDVIAVQKVFRTLADTIKETKSKLQIIVLEHASEDVWGEVDGVSLIEEWRNDKKLVPLEWLTAEES
ncbi:MAG: DUF3732 domain-containing protein [Paludisphaera borealis]|uniref:DUF3732 domain-containing protein n=1 Tax=Paludisphaera borealis TaxID=1387353 RepID=UPI00284332FC|nr:DUF3732 domain-containing protein [Paludisphaera borealis]MDR3618099.1 DUF3732 domain-containing protein [Paludisphaera borealis]